MRAASVAHLIDEPKGKPNAAVSQAQPKAPKAKAKQEAVAAAAVQVQLQRCFVGYDVHVVERPQPDGAGDALVSTT